MGKQWKQWQILFWGAPKSQQMLTAAMKLKDACSLEEKLWSTQTAYEKAETLPTKVQVVKTMDFRSRVQKWELDYKESTKELMFFNCHAGEDSFESPLDWKEINLSILKEISPEYSLEGLMLKLKLQYSGHLMWKLTHWKRISCWERLKAGGEGNNRGWDGWIAPLTQWTWV